MTAAELTASSAPTSPAFSAVAAPRSRRTLTRSSAICSIGINGTLNINPLASFQQGLSWQIGNDILGLPTGPSSFLDQVLNWGNGKLGDPQTVALLSIGDGSLIYNGPTESLYFCGGTTDPFAGTPLASLYAIATQAGVVPRLDLDAAVQPGDEFFLKVSGPPTSWACRKTAKFSSPTTMPSPVRPPNTSSASSPSGSVGGFPVCW